MACIHYTLLYPRTDDSPTRMGGREEAVQYPVSADAWINFGIGKVDSFDCRIPQGQRARGDPSKACGNGIKTCMGCRTAAGKCPAPT